MVDDLVAEGEGAVDRAYRLAVLVEVNHELFHRGSGSLVGEVQFLCGASFSLKVICKHPHHLPEEGALARSAAGRQCYFLVNCQARFNDKLRRGLEWLNTAEHVSRADHIAAAAALRADF